MSGAITILFWRDIPAQVVAKSGRTAAKRVLSPRFAEAIDRAAMRSGAKDSEAYLAEWRRGDATPCGNDLEAEADRAASAIEAAYDDQRLRALVEAGGGEPAS
jgi:hypothetical protein